jgi:hypothetical protein
MSKIKNKEQAMPDPSDVLQQIRDASGFDLYRISEAINRLLDDPEKIQAAKRQVHPGDEIEYFEASQNRMVKARLVKFQRTRAWVENLLDGKQWDIPYYAINIHNVAVGIIENTPRGLGRNEIAVGELVGFHDKEGYDRYGRVLRLNQKTVTLACENSRWRVAYCFLFKVLESTGEPFPAKSIE